VMDADLASVILTDMDSEGVRAGNGAFEDDAAIHLVEQRLNHYKSIPDLEQIIGWCDHQ
jgi:hypothetical protein